MDAASTILVGFLPGMIWLWVFHRIDRYEPEPWGRVFLVFVFGALSTIPAIILEVLFDKLVPVPSGATGIIVQCFAGIGPIEEVSKFGVVALTIYRTREFDEPLDGVVYASAAALGFASLENVLYMYQYGHSVIYVRAIMSTLGHVFFAAFWGYALGMAKTRSRRRLLIVLRGLVFAALAHGLYDAVLFTETYFAVLVLPIMVALGVQLARRVRDARRTSPFRDPSVRVAVDCPACSARIDEKSAYCPRCGAPVQFLPRRTYRFCVECGNRFSKHPRKCPTCGAQLADGPPLETLALPDVSS
jgi:RsiW-degrading membrane proteinase PrsW (M82 family)